MTTDLKAYRAKYAREITNKKHKMVRIPTELHSRLVVDGKSIAKVIEEALDNQKA